MSFEVLHVLINIDDLRIILLNLGHEAFNKFRKLWVLFPYYCFIMFILTSNVSEELLEMLRVVHDKLVYDSFV